MSVEQSPSSAQAGASAATADATPPAQHRRPLLGRRRRDPHVGLFLLPRVGGPSLTPGAYAGLARN